MPAIVKRCPKGPKQIIFLNRMQLDREVLNELTEVIEDTIEYACDHHQLSGEMVWKVVECLAIAKQAEFEGKLVPTA
jgi:hypothetical protein